MLQHREVSNTEELIQQMLERYPLGKDQRLTVLKSDGLLYLRLVVGIKRSKGRIGDLHLRSANERITANAAIPLAMLTSSAVPRSILLYHIRILRQYAYEKQYVLMRQRISNAIFRMFQPHSAYSSDLNEACLVMANFIMYRVQHLRGVRRTLDLVVDAINHYNANRNLILSGDVKPHGILVAAINYAYSCGFDSAATILNCIFSSSDNPSSAATGYLAAIDSPSYLYYEVAGVFDALTIDRMLFTAHADSYADLLAGIEGRNAAPKIAEHMRARNKSAYFALRIHTV